MISLDLFINSQIFTIYDKNFNIFRRIRFADKLPKNKIAEKTSIFSNDVFNVEELKKYRKTAENKKEIFEYFNILLFKSLTLNELLFFVSLVTNIPFENIAYDKKELMEPSILQTISIGDAVFSFVLSSDPVEFNVINSKSSFLVNYTHTYEYFQKLNLTRATLSTFVDSITFRSIYGGKIVVSLPKLFNLLSVGELFNKIIIHDVILDDYYGNAVKTQYIKAGNDVKFPFKNTHTTFNLLTIYLNYKVTEKIYLIKVDINKIGNVSHVYSIIDAHYEIGEMLNDIKDFIKNRFKKEIFANLMIGEAVYSEFNENAYTHTNIKALNSVTKYNTAKHVKISTLNDLIAQEIPEIKYHTKTSLCINGFAFYSPGVLETVKEILINHDYITPTTLKKLLLPNIIASNFISNELVTIVQDATDWGNLVFNILWIMLRFPLNMTEKKQQKQDAESIIAKAKNIPSKNLLKTLENIDYRLFGPRYVKGKIRPYSGLAQKNNQRVVPITFEEYEIVKKKFPDRVCNIENQSTGARLFLLCPYSVAPFINFHYSPGEICVPKCTIKKHNRNQYTICAKQLNISDFEEYSTQYENKNIVLFNPLIFAGRRCFVPEEFETLLNEYILLKLPKTENITAYIAENYKLEPYIIQRNLIDLKYTVYTEYNDETDYCLLFRYDHGETSNDSAEYLLTIDENNEPLKFSKNVYVRDFFKRISYTDNNKNAGFFNYVKRLIGLNNLEIYGKKLIDILSDIEKKHDIKFLYSGNYICAALFCGKLYLLPFLFIPFAQISATTENPQKTSKKNELSKILNNPRFYPEINDLKPLYVEALYRDYDSKAITMVKFLGVNTFIKPFKYIPAAISCGVILYDQEAALINVFSNLPGNAKAVTFENIRETVTNSNFEYILNKWLYIYLINCAESVPGLSSGFKSSDFVKFLEKNNIAANNNGEAVEMFNRFILWRKSKIPKDYIKKFIEKIDRASLSAILQKLNITIYEHFNGDILFNINENEKLSSKKITF